MGELLRRSFPVIPVILLAGWALSPAAPGQTPSGKAAPGKAAEQAGAPAGEGQPSPEGAAVRPPNPSDFWLLDFTYQKVAAFQPTEGIRKGDTYWYMIYRIDNKTGKDRDAYISITARSNHDQSYANICLPDIEGMIEQKLGKALWGKTDEVNALKERSAKGEVAAEKANFNYFPFKAGESRECVAIFNKLDPRATHITITVEGLSNDMHVIQREGGPKQIESRIYVLKLERPGDEYAMNLDQFRLVKKGTGWSKKLTELALPKKG